MSSVVSATDLIPLLRAGSTEALSEAYQLYSPLVRRIAFRVTNSAADAEDVVQDVFIGLPEAVGRYEERGSFPSWLSVLTTRTALARVRSETRRRSADWRGAPGALDTVRSPDDAVTARLTIERALSQLSEEQRIVVALREMEGRSYAEIGELLGIRRGTAEVRFHRALKRLRQLLENSR